LHETLENATVELKHAIGQQNQGCPICVILL